MKADKLIESNRNFSPPAQVKELALSQSFGNGSPASFLDPALKSAVTSSAILHPRRRPSWLPEDVWPFQTVGLDVDESRIAVIDVGKGPTLLFVHTGFWSFVWRDVILRLSGEFRCVCFDAPGTGQSNRLPAGSINLEKAARALTEVIRALNLTDITLVVHDLGGPSGIAGAAKVPERIRALCAINSFAWKPTGAGFRGMLALMGSAPMRELSAWSGILLQITRTSFGVGKHMNPSSRSAFSAGVDRQAMRAFHGYMRDARKCDGVYEELYRAFSGPFRALPLLTIFGERNDPLGFQPRWKELFSDARQLVISKGNHFPMCDDPDFVASAIREWHWDSVAPSFPSVARHEIEPARK